MLAHRLRLWANIKSTLVQRHVFAGECPFLQNNNLSSKQGTLTQCLFNAGSGAGIGAVFVQVRSLLWIKQKRATINPFKANLFQKTRKPEYKLTYTGPECRDHTKIRLGLSAINQQRFTYNLIETKYCDLCKDKDESREHYFFRMPTCSMKTVEAYHPFTWVRDTVTARCISK